MSLVAKSHFLGAETGTYLYSAGEGLVPRSAISAVESYFEHKVDPVHGHAHHQSIDRRVREQLAQLMDADPADIALLGNASQGISAIYSLIDWQPGDNVVLVTNDLEFPSVVIPAVKRVKDGILETRIVGWSDWIVTPEMVAETIDDSTRLVFVSHVSYRTGYRIDLEKLGDLVHRTGALLAIDATQSLGVVPVASYSCDFLVAASCKWLLAPHGVGVFYWNRQRLPDVEPHDIGWYSVVNDLEFPYKLKPGAERFELGGPAWPSIYAMEQGLQILLDCGIPGIDAHVSALSSRLLAELTAFDKDVITPRQPAQHAGIVSWLEEEPERTARQLAEHHQVFVTGSSGRIRVGFHIYNDDSDIDSLLNALSQRY